MVTEEEDGIGCCETCGEEMDICCGTGQPRCPICEGPCPYCDDGGMDAQGEECEHDNAVLSDPEPPATYYCPDCGETFIGAHEEDDDDDDADA